MFCFVWINFLIRFFSLSSKSVFVTKFACANLAAKFSAVSLLNSGVVIYLSWIWSVILFSIFLTKLLTLGISFSTAVRATVVAKLLILGISALTWFILAFRVVLVAKLVISGMLPSRFLILALYSVFLTTSFFTTLLSLLNSTGVVSNFPISNLSTLVLNYLNYLVHFLVYQYLIYQPQLLNWLNQILQLA